MAFGTSHKSSGNTVTTAIQVLERRDIDLLPVDDCSSYVNTGSSSPWGGGRFDFIKILSISKALPENKADVERFLMEDVVSGLYGLKVPLVYLIIGSRLKVSVYYGILRLPGGKVSPTACVDSLISSLQGTFPDIEVERVSDDEINKNIMPFFQGCKHYGVMTGIPTAKFGVEEHGIEQIERLMRGLTRNEFCYMVIADPVSDEDVVEAFDDITGIIKENSVLIKESTQYVKTSRLTAGGESVNRSVQYYVEILEMLLDKLKLSKAQGMWRTMTYFASPDHTTAVKMSNLLKTVFSGDKSAPEAVRTIILNNASPSAVLAKFKQIELALNYHPPFAAEHPLRKIIKHKFATALCSRDLATLTHLPKEEMPGYDVKDTARFGVCLPETRHYDDVIIGEVLDRGKGTGNHYGLPVQDLVKHGLIVGVTGSGKTNTCLNLLGQLWQGPSKTPFLVIEPAKAEYRALLNIKGYEELLVFTLGDEMTSPFRINPFEIMEGVKLQTHIDNLRAVFNASFIMYAPMPYVLERCIHEIYKDKGWDLTTNQNRLLGIHEKSPYGIFPTLTDLYNKIDPVVEAMGYEDRLTLDIKAGLKARIGSLRIGGKGSMLDTALSIPMHVLLSKPVILELQSIGDDEEKAFIIGLIIARLYEYREIEGRLKGGNRGLQHVTLIEEAHRLLKKSSSDFSNLENVSTKAKAVETFCNILSEIRAFGEGILIAEQIPAKLADDAVKNTNLKIMHRIVAKDDRDLMGHTMNLDERQNRFMSIIDRGSAAVFSEGFGAPFLVSVPHYFATAKPINPKTSTVQDKDICRAMASKLKFLDYVFGKHTGCATCQYKCAYRDTAARIVEQPDALRIFVRYIFAIAEKPENLAAQYPVYRDAVLGDIKDSLKNADEVNDLMFCVLITAGERFIRNRIQQYGLQHQDVFALLEAYNNLINAYFTLPVKTQLSRETETCLQEFRRCLQKTFSVKNGPFPGCNEHCKYKCLFRYDMEFFAKDPAIDSSYKDIIRNSAPHKAKSELRKFCLETAQNASMGNSSSFVENMALCFFIQKSVQDSVKEILLNIEKWFFDIKGK